MDRITLGKMTNPVRGFLHGTAALASVIGLVLLVLRTTGDPPRLVSVAIFGLTLVAAFSTSALYHSVPWREVWKYRWQKLDHSAIYLLIAGTWTPLAANVLGGWFRWVVLGVIWGLAMVGVVQKLAFPGVRDWFGFSLYLVMGWIALIPLPRFIDRLPAEALWLMLAGGVLYTIGSILFATRRPRLFPRIFSFHEVWHIFVVTAAVMHFLMVLLYVVPVSPV